jgi:hypothetical protein
MEWFIGFLGAVVGTAAGGLSVFLTTRAQMRRELEHAYDQELRTRRVESYMSLYKRTDKLPRYYSPGEQPVRREMQGWVRAFDDWYFGEAGGMFLSDKARQAYHDALDVIAAVSDGPPDATLADSEIERLWRAGQALRRTLAADVGAAEIPRLPGREPVKSPSAAIRFRIQGSQEVQEQTGESAKGPGGPIGAEPPPDTRQVGDV